MGDVPRLIANTPRTDPENILLKAVSSFEATNSVVRARDELQLS